MTTHSALTPMLHIKCTNDEIKYILHNLYYNVMNVEHNLFGWARTMLNTETSLFISTLTKAKEFKTASDYLRKKSRDSKERTQQTQTMFSFNGTMHR